MLRAYVLTQELYYNFDVHFQTMLWIIINIIKILSYCRLISEKEV